VRAFVLVGVLLVGSVLLGITLQPDDGTAVHLGRTDAVVLAGANHAKPMPRIATPADLTPMLATVVGLLALAVIAAARPVRRDERATWRADRQDWARAVSRRGPPLVA
jgi:hypothetical protein